MSTDVFLSEITSIRNRAVFMLILNHKLKAQEIANLRKDDIDYQNNKVIVKQDVDTITRVLHLEIGHVNILKAYMRVRTPTSEKRVFLREDGLSRGQPQSDNDIMEQFRIYF